jgi:PadR family transcriptional regulator PadR
MAGSLGYLAEVDVVRMESPQHRRVRMATEETDRNPTEDLICASAIQRYYVLVVTDTEYQRRRCLMGKLATEMLKGTLEGIVLAILAGRPAYGYEITAGLREKGFSDIAEGTIYALLIRIEQRGLVDVEKVPSEKGPPRKVYSLNTNGQEYLDEFWRTWTSLAEQLEQLRTGDH